jgi:hypothetical protein
MEETGQLHADALADAAQAPSPLESVSSAVNRYRIKYRLKAPGTVGSECFIPIL